MNVLILGSGGREHAMAWKIAQSPLLTNLFISPGNSGTLQHGENVSLDVSNYDEIKAFVLNKDIAMVVVGPEAPLVDGIHDYFKADAQTISIHTGGLQGLSGMQSKIDKIKDVH